MGHFAGDVAGAVCCIGHCPDELAFAGAAVDVVWPMLFTVGRGRERAAEGGRTGRECGDAGWIA